MKGQLSIETVLMLLLVIGAVGGFFVFFRSVITDTQAGAEKALIYPEQPPQILTTRCFLDHGYAILETDRLVGDLNYRVKNTAGVNVKTGVISANISERGKVYFSALLDRDSGYLVEFYTTKWSTVDTCNARVHDDALLYVSFDTISSTTEDLANSFTVTSYDVQSTSGKLNNAASFNSSTQYFEVEDVIDFNITKPFTLSTFIKFGQASSASAPVIKGPGNPKYDNYLLYSDPTGNFLQFFIGMCNDTYPPSINIIGSGSFDTWYHVVAVYNGTHSLGYLDGNFVESTEVYYEPCQYALPLRFGHTWSQYFNGTMDEFYFFNAALDADVISSIYEAYN